MRIILFLFSVFFFLLFSIFLQLWFNMRGRYYRFNVCWNCGGGDV